MKHVIFYSPRDAPSAQVIGAIVAFGKRDRFVVVNTDHRRPSYVTSVPYVVSASGAHIAGTDAVTLFVASLTNVPEEAPSDVPAPPADDVEAFVLQEMLGFSDGYSYIGDDASLPHQFDFLATPQPPVALSGAGDGLPVDRRAGLPSMEDILASRDRQLKA